MPIQIDEAAARAMSAQFDAALVLVRNEFGGLDGDSQYRNAFARLLKQDPLGRVPMLGTDQRDWFVPALQGLVEEVVPAGGHVLDVGGGDGQTVALLAGALPERVSVSLIEPNGGYVDDYRGWLDSQPHLDAGKLTVAELDEIDLSDSGDSVPEDGSVHLVLALHMLYFVADPAASLVRMARFLAPGGALAVVVADEVRGYTGQALRRFVEAGGDTGSSAADLAGVAVRDRLMNEDRLAGAISTEVRGANVGVQVRVQPTRLYGHTLGDLIALSAIAELAAVEGIMKFEVAAELLRLSPEAVDLRIEDEGPRKGMWSVAQPQHLAIVWRFS